MGGEEGLNRLLQPMSVLTGKVPAPMRQSRRHTSPYADSQGRLPRAGVISRMSRSWRGHATGQAERAPGRGSA